MPVLEISDGHGNLAPLAHEKVLAAMVHPQDIDCYAQYLAWSIVNAFAKEPKDGQPAGVARIPREVLAAVLLSPSFKDVSELAKREIESAHIVGEMLEIILSCRYHHPEYPPSISKARDVMSALRRTRARADADPSVSHSVSFLKEQWRKFKPVAHLWAAHNLIESQKLREAIWGLEDERALLLFLGVAERLRRQAEEIVPHGRSEPILIPAEMWTVPTDLNIPIPGPIEPAPLPDDVLALLRSRRAPRRG